MDILPVDDSLLQVGQWATLALIPGQRRDTAKNMFVVSITHYKCHTEEQHEKLLLILKTPRDGASPSKMTYVVTDRGPNTHDVDSQRCQASSMLLSSASPSLRVISPLSPDVRANDQIFIPGTGAPSLKRYKRQLSQRYNALCTMTLTTAMSLAQLAVLLQAVNLHSVYYNPLKYQCYWYAYTIWEVLCMEFGGIVAENRLQDKQGKYMGFNIACEDSVEAITGIYTCAWQKLCEEEIQIRKNEEELVRQVNFTLMIT
jgi:hypothetical protein